jgi:4-hydroxy-tetrahydrodipicolinate reductase
MTYRIIQWSSGNVGTHALRAVAQRAGLELSGLYVYSANKVGVDAGQIAGVENLGVAASDDRDAMLVLDADCVLHTPLPSLVYGDDPDEDLTTICELLASGKNVITTVGYLYPSVHGEAVTQRIAAACEQGNSSFHSTGINPGWMGDLVPLVMSGICQRIDLVHVQEITNFQFYPSPEIIFDMMGFGLAPEKFEQHAARYTHWLTGLFRESIQMVADGLGLALDEITEHSEFELCDEPLQVAAGPIAAGTIAGQRWEWAGTVKGQKKIIHETIWRTHDSLGDQWPRGNHSVRITGLPDMYVDFGAGWNSDVLLSTALHAVNAIPSVCEAAPGIRTLLDLPMIVARGGVST